jgi:predicted regulator of amino acid metabolism with ACT domain
MNTNKRLTVEQIETALKKKAGNIAQAAKELGVERNTVYAHIKSSPTLQTVLQNTREELVDIAESALLRGVLDGNMTAIIWTLKASPAAKARGWSERQELTGADGGAVTVKVIYDDIDLNSDAS